MSPEFEATVVVQILVYVCPLYLVDEGLPLAGLLPTLFHIKHQSKRISNSALEMV